MNEASRWRLDLARDVAAAYADIATVRVVEVGGSVSRGCADRYSDIEIGVFWSEPPTEQERMLAARRAGGLEYRPFGHELGEWTEDYIGGGVKIDVSHRLVSSMEGLLDDVVSRYDTDVAKQNLISAIQYAIPVYGEGVLAEWRTRADAYPNALAEAMVRDNLMLGPQQWLQMLAERGSVIELYEILCRIEKRLLGMLMGLNHVYHPGFKWFDRLIGELPVAPPEIGERLKRLFRLDPTEAVVEVDSLIMETYGLVNAMMPQVDTGPALARLRQERPTCDESPGWE